MKILDFSAIAIYKEQANSLFLVDLQNKNASDGPLIGRETKTPMLHHISLPVSDLAKASRLYDAALAALGYRRVASAEGFAGYGIEDGKDKFALKQVSSAVAAGPGFHLALAAPSWEAVDQFHQIALAHGAANNGAPRLRPHYGPNYYAAFITDLDGHRIEAVYNQPPSMTES